MSDLWKRKLAAWLHDPAEKALVLMRDHDNQGVPLGHESGSVADLRAVLGISRSDFDKRADHYAAAADRPQWPFEEGKPRPSWANVRFVQQPVLVHPLNLPGTQDIELAKLVDIAAPHIRHASLAHFLELIEKDDAGEIDNRLTQLAFWRFGPEPELAAPELGELWRLLPADTRVPDHSIWSHLDVVSALAGALGEGDPALLTMSFGPVQGFIAQARSTSDLWAGSHLLSSLAWEGLKVVCDELGPDAILFPHLRGIAAVDLWLMDQVRAERREAWLKRFRDIDAQWLNGATDANPLFAATLPNKFMALVPAGRARDIAARVEVVVRAAALRWTEQAAERVFAQAGLDAGPSAHWRAQVAGQLHGFPEVHWSVADWPTGSDADGLPDVTELKDRLADFYPADADAPGVFATPMWKTLCAGDAARLGISLPSGEMFFKPNPGLVYPAVHDLAERELAAGKTLRAFGQLPQEGYRCTVTGEHEWLTHDAALLRAPRGARDEHGEPVDSAWRRVEGTLGIKTGERLGALATLKRLWPTMFVERVRESLELEGEARMRYVVSTHTMALATSIDLALARDGENLGNKLIEFSRQRELGSCDRVALPRSLHKRARQLGSAAADALARLPSFLEGGSTLDDEGPEAGQVGRLLGVKPEAYYALLQLDGDHMGAWMSGTEADYQRSFADSWHPQVRESVRQKFGGQPDMRRYMDASRPMSPARHAAISCVLNDFSTHVARHVVEDVFKGKLLYAGGDDVLAMMSVDDLLPAMLLLRAAYSGYGDFAGVPGVDADGLCGLEIGRGFVRLRGRLMPMMGTAATASIGAVVAHHQAPLAAVLRELRSAEARAKRHGRNAFSLKLIKRGGGSVETTCSFWRKGEVPRMRESSVGILLDFAAELSKPDVSRRAVYNAVEWVSGLPQRTSAGDAAWREMAAGNLAWQLTRQKAAGAHARLLVDLACDNSGEERDTAALLERLLVTAEFFARKSRMAEGAK